MLSRLRSGQPLVCAGNPHQLFLQRRKLLARYDADAGGRVPDCQAWAVGNADVFRADHVAERVVHHSVHIPLIAEHAVLRHVAVDRAEQLLGRRIPIAARHADHAEICLAVWPQERGVASGSASLHLFQRVVFQIVTRRDAGGVLDAGNRSLQCADRAGEADRGSGLRRPAQELLDRTIFQRSHHIRHALQHGQLFVVIDSRHQRGGSDVVSLLGISRHGHALGGVSRDADHRGQRSVACVADIGQRAVGPTVDVVQRQRVTVFVGRKTFAPEDHAVWLPARRQRIAQLGI
jgi:hypothetical protein